MSNDLNKKCLCLEIMKILNYFLNKILFVNFICNLKLDCYNYY